MDPILKVLLWLGVSDTLSQSRPPITGKPNAFICEMVRYLCQRVTRYLLTYNIHVTSRMIVVAIQLVSEVGSIEAVALLMCVDDLG
jgi:hypothetical protein